MIGDACTYLLFGAARARLSVIGASNYGNYCVAVMFRRCGLRFASRRGRTLEFRPLPLLSLCSKFASRLPSRRRTRYLYVVLC